MQLRLPPDEHGSILHSNAARKGLGAEGPASPPSRLPRGMIRGGEIECRCQPREGVRPRAAVDAALEVGDGACAETGPFRERLLSEAGCQAVAPEHIAEA